MSVQGMAKANLSPTFATASLRKAKKKKVTDTTPFSLRFTREERTYLEQQAGNQHLGAYLRERLLNEHVKKRRVLRKPKIDDQKLAIVLSLFGDQRIASNLNQLARHANMGTLDVSDEEILQLQEACAAMIAVRNYMLDIKPEQSKED